MMHIDVLFLHPNSALCARPKKRLTNIKLYYNIKGMIKIIENVLKDLADMQLNLASDVARTWIAQKVEKAIIERQQQSEDVLAEVAELNRNTTMGVDDIIVSAMEHEGYIKGDSGYDIRRGIRDVTFHASNGDQYEVTFRKIKHD